MQVQVNPLSKSLTEFKVVVPHSELDAIYDQQYRSMSSARVDGFRAGHFTKSAFLQKYGKRVQQSIFEDYTQRAVKEVYKTIRDQQISIFKHLPDSVFKNDVQYEGYGKDFTFSVTYFLTPENLEKRDLSQIELDAIKISVTDEDLKKTEEQLCLQAGTMEDFSGAVEMGKGHVLKIDSVATFAESGEPMKGGTFTGMTLRIDRDRMIPGFSEALVGHSVNETVSTVLTFPEDYHAEDLRNAKVKFDITIKSVKHLVPAELNLDLFKKLNCKSMEEGEASLKAQLALKARHQSVTYNQLCILKALKEIYPEVHAPEEYVTLYVERELEKKDPNFKNLPAQLRPVILEYQKAAYRPNVDFSYRAYCMMSLYDMNLTVSEEELEPIFQLMASNFDGADQASILKELKKDKEARASAGSLLALEKFNTQMQSMVKSVNTKECSCYEADKLYAELNNELNTVFKAEAKAALEAEEAKRKAEAEQVAAPAAPAVAVADAAAPAAPEAEAAPAEAAAPAPAAEAAPASESTQA